MEPVNPFCPSNGPSPLTWCWPFWLIHIHRDLSWGQGFVPDMDTVANEGQLSVPVLVQCELSTLYNCSHREILWERDPNPYPPPCMWTSHLMETDMVHIMVCLHLTSAFALMSTFASTYHCVNGDANVDTENGFKLIICMCVCITIDSIENLIQKQTLSVNRAYTDHKWDALQ